MAAPKLKIENTTAWSTRDLRRLFLAGMRHVGVDGAKHVTVNYRKRVNSSRGHARIGRRTNWHDGTVVVHEAEQVWLHMVNPTHGPTVSWGDDTPWPLCEPGQMTPQAVTDLARTIEHELMHTLGHHHRQMVKSWHLPVAWAEGYTVRWLPKPAVAKPTRGEAAATAAAQREARARRHLARLEAEAKITAVLLAKWRARVRYYDRRAAARPKEKP